MPHHVLQKGNFKTLQGAPIPNLVIKSCTSYQLPQQGLLALSFRLRKHISTSMSKIQMKVPYIDKVHVQDILTFRGDLI